MAHMNDLCHCYHACSLSHSCVQHAMTEIIHETRVSETRGSNDWDHYIYIYIYMYIYMYIYIYIYTYHGGLCVSETRGSNCSLSHLECHYDSLLHLKCRLISFFQLHLHLWSLCRTCVAMAAMVCVSDIKECVALNGAIYIYICISHKAYVAVNGTIV